jgi:hypothetical protein
MAELRKETYEYLKGLGVPTTSENILVTSGSQQGIILIARSNNATNQEGNNASSQGGSDFAEAAGTIGGGAAGAMAGSILGPIGTVEAVLQAVRLVTKLARMLAEITLLPLTTVKRAITAIQ